MLASNPASRMNQNFNAAGIPRDSGAVENALDAIADPLVTDVDEDVATELVATALAAL